MARVKCRDTGEYSTSNIAYKDPKGKYWSSEDAYLKHQEQMTWFHKCVELMMCMLDYDNNTPATLVMKNLKRYEKVGYDVAYETIQQQAEAIAWSLKNKTFTREFNKISYVFRIIDNNVIDVYKNKQRLAMTVNRNQTVSEDDLSYDASIGKNDPGHSVLHLIGDDVL